jgi:hypothetical protein
MASRSEARTEFLGDIITAAVEGGTGYWAQVSQYQWVDDLDPGKPVRVSVGERVGDGARAVLHPLNEDESGYEETGHVIDVEKIAMGLATIEREIHCCNERLRKRILRANRENDAGLIDADDADVIVQIAIFDQIVYG